MTTHCLPQRIKLTFSEIFSSGVFSKGTVNEEKIANPMRQTVFPVF